jgi:hypothetical protein
MVESHEYDELVEYLRAEGHSQREIDKILERVAQYERETQLDSLMDSIGNGSLDLPALIKEALGEGH